MGDERKEVFVLHNVVAPYRLPIFEDIDDEFDATIGFCHDATNREWSNDAITDLNTVFFPSVSLLGIVFNYGIFFHLIRHDYDAYIIAETTSVSPTVLLAGLLSRLMGIPVVTWTEGIKEGESRPKPDSIGMRILSRFRLIYQDIYRSGIFLMSDWIVALSPYAEDNVRRLTSGQEVQTTIQSYPSSLLAEPGSLSDNFEEEIREVIEGNKIVLYLGYLRNGKGIEILMNVFEEFLEKDISLFIAGSGPLEDTLKQTAPEEGVQFTGYIEGEKKATLIANSDVLVLPTLYDAWGLVINEAFYYNTPVITTTNAGAAEIARGRGDVIRPGSRAALRRSLQYVLETDPDRLFRDPVTDDLFDSKTISDPLIEGVYRVTD